MPLEVKLALGRLLRMLSRPWQPGDDALYPQLRGIILDASETRRFPPACKFKIVAPFPRGECFVVPRDVLGETADPTTGETK